MLIPLLAPAALYGLRRILGEFAKTTQACRHPALCRLSARRAVPDPEQSSAAIARRRRLERFGVAHRDAENPAGRRLEDHRDPVAIPAYRRCDRARGAAVPRDLFEAAHDIDMREDPPAILASLDLCLAAIESQRNRQFLVVASREVERMLDIGTVRADRLPTAVDDNLGR